VLVQRKVRHDLLQLPVLILQLAKAAELGDPNPLILALPAVEGLLAYPKLPADFPDWLPGFHLLQGVRDLLLGETGLAHRRPPL